ncbi:MAG TPA: hypothetical protein VIG82_03425 [Enteractinococcus sp.]
MPSENEIPKDKAAKRARRDKAARRAQKMLSKAVDSKGRPKPAFQRAVLAVMRAQRPLVIANLRRLTKKHPHDSPGELAERMSRRYIAALATTGATAGGVGAVPGIGTATSLGASFGAALGFLELTALYAQSIAELAGLHTKTDQQAQALVMTIMLGEEGRELLQQAATSQPGSRFGTLGPSAWLASGLTGLTERAFSALANRFMRTLVRGEAVRFLGRMVPFGIGAGIGGVANRNLARQVVIQTQETFGQLPQWEHLPELFAELNSPRKSGRRLKSAKSKPAIQSATEDTDE